MVRNRSFHSPKGGPGYIWLPVAFGSAHSYCLETTVSASTDVRQVISTHRVRRMHLQHYAILRPSLRLKNALHEPDVLGIVGENDGDKIANYDRSSEQRWSAFWAVTSKESV
jgi:hypothetical protein